MKVIKMHRIKNIYISIKCLKLVLKHPKNCVHAIKVNKKVGKEYSLWIRMIDIQNGLDVENIYRLVRKEIHRRFATKKTTDDQVKNYKRYD